MIELCWLCETRPITSLKKPLCHGCYSLCRKRRLLHIFPMREGSCDTRERTIKRYGPPFLADMESLQAGNDTLTAVGKRYGLSRERIRQLYKIFYGMEYTAIVLKKLEVLADQRKKADIEKNIFENRFKRASKNHNTYVAIMAEKIFLEKCKNLGYSIEMMRGHFLWDATVNGIPVDIKTCSVAANYTGKGKQIYYRLGTNNKQKAAVKYFPLYLVDEDSWYIIPAHKVTSDNYFIPKYDSDLPTSYKYKDVQQYREAWHLLKGQAHEGQQDF